MKNLLFVCCILLLPFSACAEAEKGPRWEIKEENPVYGLSLRYLLPLEQLQAIAGSKITPRTNDEGMGYLNLTFMASEKYYLDGIDQGRLAEVHLLVFSQDSVGLRFSMGTEDLELNDVFRNYNFNSAIGDVILRVEEGDEFISIEALARTDKGSIAIHAKAPNSPGELKSSDSVKVVSAQKPNSYFMGSESSRRIAVDSVSIDEWGDNWISALNLPAKPQSVTFSIFDAWNFVFAEESGG